MAEIIYKIRKVIYHIIFNDKRARTFVNMCRCELKARKLQLDIQHI
jgi:hypothetical protein